MIEEIYIIENRMVCKTLTKIKGFITSRKYFDHLCKERKQLADVSLARSFFLEMGQKIELRSDKCYSMQNVQNLWTI